MWHRTPSLEACACTSHSEIIAFPRNKIAVHLLIGKLSLGLMPADTGLGFNDLHGHPLLGSHLCSCPQPVQPHATQLALIMLAAARDSRKAALPLQAAGLARRRAVVILRLSCSADPL